MGMVRLILVVTLLSCGAFGCTSLRNFAYDVMYDNFDRETNPDALSGDEYRRRYVKENETRFAVEILAGELTRGMSREEVRAAWNLHGTRRPGVTVHLVDGTIHEQWSLPRNMPYLRWILSFRDGVLVGYTKFD